MKRQRPTTSYSRRRSMPDQVRAERGLGDHRDEAIGIGIGLGHGQCTGGATRTAGRVRSQGVELDVAGNLTDSLSLIGSYAYTDARVVDDPDNKGKEMTNVARHTAS